MKVAVYTVALNEEKFVERWYESAKNADYLLIADSGSTDKTVEIAKKLGINVFNIYIDPWRFDLARNASLALIPPDIDYCIQLDMDEVLVGEWKKELEKAFLLGITHPKYNYEFSPEAKFKGYKIHPRKNTIWKYPIHEDLHSYGDIKETNMDFNFSIIHYPDINKSRSQYLSMLQNAVKEYPNDSRMEYFLGREYFDKNDWENAYYHLHNALRLNTSHQLPCFDMLSVVCYYLNYKNEMNEHIKKAYSLNPDNKILQKKMMHIH